MFNVPMSAAEKNALTLTNKNNIKEKPPSLNLSWFSGKIQQKRLSPGMPFWKKGATQSTSGGPARRVFVPLCSQSLHESEPSHGLMSTEKEQSINQYIL